MNIDAEKFTEQSSIHKPVVVVVVLKSSKKKKNKTKKKTKNKVGQLKSILCQNITK